MKNTKYIFVTGGVLSSLGKGISCSSIGVLLQQAGFSVSILKIDPYINVDPGTMSPLEHGEVFVTADGAETDLDIGHYERFLNINFSRDNNFTTGQIYLSVIDRERRGDYLGKTIQIVPHVTDEIKSRIKKVGEGVSVLIVELGGTVGDIEGMPYLEALRQLKQELGANNVLSVHVTLVPYIRAADELKTKPTQHSVQELRRIGLNPQLIIARSEMPLSNETKEKIALSCDLALDSVISAQDADTIYQCPLNFKEEGILTPIARGLQLDSLSPDMQAWDLLVKKIRSPTKTVEIGFVGKYLSLKESYKSLLEALIHAGANLDTRVNISFINAEHIEEDEFANLHGILVPGGFGERGVAGKIKAIKHAREVGIPFLGICLGMQLALIEFARSVLCLQDCNSTEFQKDCENPIVYLIEDFIDLEGNKQIRTHTSPLGGTMRLGDYDCHIKPGSKLAKAYGNQVTIKERHRHRYEVNPKYRKDFEEAGLIVSGDCGGLVEAVELDSHPFFVGVQFHPEFTSRLQNPNPIIVEFIKQAHKYKS